jgi:hypothetical protein
MRKPVLFVLSLVLLSACQASQPPQVTPALRWFSSCGDPVCGNPQSTPQPNTCGDKVEGQICTQEGQSCDLGNECHQKLICARSDPKLSLGGCPISKAVYKNNIHYLNPAERETLAQQLQNLKLATWQYNHEPQGPSRLGFIIEDQPPAQILKPDQNAVDLYGYLSLAVATLQSQQQTIDQLEKRLTALEFQCKKAKP